MLEQGSLVELREGPLSVRESPCFQWWVCPPPFCSSRSPKRDMWLTFDSNASAVSINRLVEVADAGTAHRNQEHAYSR